MISKILSWLKLNWFQILIIVLLLYAISTFSTMNSSIRELENEVSDIADGIEIEIVDCLNDVPGLPCLP